jgi:hypothetical protein
MYYTIGFRPNNDAPIANPVKPASDIGVSTIFFGPCLASNPLVILCDP